MRLEVHVFPSGDHGDGLAIGGGAFCPRASAWVSHAASWLAAWANYDL